MKLLHLSIASIVGCASGLVILLLLTAHGANEISTAESELGELFRLRERIEDLSTRVDSIALLGADARLATRMRAEASAIRAQLEQLAASHPDAAKVAERIEMLIDSLDAGRAPAADRGESATAAAIEPAPIAADTRILLAQIAGHGVALDTALDPVLRERRALLAERAEAAATRQVSATILFGVLCMAAFGILYWRVAAPIRALTDTVERIGAGARQARAKVTGDDEISTLGRALNRMLDQRDASAQRLQQYRLLVESSEDLMAIADQQYRYLMVNQAYARLLGRDRSEIEGARIADLLGRTYFEEVAKPRLDACLTGQPQRYETERLNANGSLRQLLVRCIPLATEHDDASCQVLAVITDISELKQAEMQLRQQSHLLDVAGRVARIGGWRVDLANNRVSWSDVVAEIHGLPPGTSPAVEDGIRFYHGEDQARIRAVFSACAEHGIPYNEELRIVDTDGQLVWVRTTGEPVFDSDGRIVAVHGGLQDISAQKSAEEDAEALSERLQKTLESITDGFFTLDREWRFTYLNQEAARLLQRPREELLGQGFWDCFPDAIGTRLERAYRQAMIAQETAIFEEYYRPFGTWFDVRAYPSADGLAVYLQDVTDRHRMVRSLQSQKAALRRSRDQLAELVQTRKALIDSLPAHIALLDDQGVIVDVNNQWRRFGEQNGLGDERSGVGSNYIAICEAASGACAVEAPAIACGLRDVLAGERQTFVLEYPCHSPTEQRWFRVAANRLRPSNDAPVNARGEGAVVMHVDITERKLAELELDALVNRDRLTNLLTRNGFTKALGERLKRIDGSPRAVLAMFDIKDLRDINDSHGFQAGDQLLIEIARWLEQHAGDQGLVGRIAGDEFSVLLPLTPGADPHARIEALQRISQHVFLNPDSGIEIALDIGYTVVGDSPPSAEELLHQAELALFQHPPHGTAPPIAYNTELDTQVHERLELSRDLRAALDDHQFELHFQPKVQLTDGSLVACEALLRWNHPQRGLQPPGVFIPIAEQSQLIGPLGEWALHEACRRLREWQAAGLNVVGLAVNVSLIQFRIADFSHAVRAALDAHEVDPGALTLEITESVFADASDALLEELNALRAVGVRLSLDDFGTGYSSLAYLQRYPFDEIKVDRCFVARVREDRYSRTVLQAVKGIADALGANLIAEGIETEAVRQALIELGFEHGQGYLFSMPLETEDFRWLLEQGCQLPLGPDMP